MTDPDKETRLDEVLRAFDAACAQPTVEQITEWTTRHPEFAEDIRDFAGVLWDEAAAGCQGEEADVDDIHLARARSHAFNVLHDVRGGDASVVASKGDATFDSLMQDAGWTTVALESAMDLSREVLSDLFRGRMAPPVGRRLADAVIGHLRTTEARFMQAYEHALARPSLGQARATRQPSIVRRSFADIVRASDMTPGRKAYWLEED